MKYIDADKLITKIEKSKNELKSLMSKLYYAANYKECKAELNGYNKILSIVSSLQQEQPEVDLMDTRIQYASVHDGIKSFAETYSFNIDSQLFPQLSKEQQELWRKEIEQAAVSGGDIGITLARDVRYNENQSQPEVDLEKEIDKWFDMIGDSWNDAEWSTNDIRSTARHFYELGINARKEE